jgi:DNA-binding NarL/FixJ family response regulator
MSKAHLTVVIADENPLFRAALRQGVLELSPQAAVVEADSYEALRAAAARKGGASLALLDLHLPGMDGLSSLRRLREEFPALRVAMVSNQPQRLRQRSLRVLGAAGLVPRSATPAQMQQVWRELLAGREWWPQAAPALAGRGNGGGETRLERLSPQELRILMHLKEGRRNKQIADSLGISASTVKAHISAILHKLDLESRTQAAVLAQRLLASDAP